MYAKACNTPSNVSYSEILALVTGVLRDAKGQFRASVYEVDYEGQRAIWKDMNAHLWLLRRSMGAALVREANILCHLHSIPGIPAVLAIVGKAGFVMEKMEGECLPRHRDHWLTLQYFNALRELILKMHERGVAHGDLRRMNILCNVATQQPRLIDFGTAHLLRENSNPIRRWIWQETCRIDLQHYAKIKKSYFPKQLTAEEQAWLDYKPFYYRLGHFFRNSIYRPIRRCINSRKQR